VNITNECIPCLALQATELARSTPEDSLLQQQVLRAALGELAKLSLAQTPPEIAHRMHQAARCVTTIPDPYQALKATYNAVASGLAGALRREQRVESSADPFDTACRLAIAGNIIDFGAGLDLRHGDVLRSVEEGLSQPLFGTGSRALREAADGAKDILYLADNAGEIVFDRFLVELLPPGRVTLVVKGGPIVNDATMEDALAAGFPAWVRVMDNGHDAQGTLLPACSQAFREAFDQADLIISKGQANFETLSGVPGKQIFFLLRAKCQPVADALGCARMAFVLTDQAGRSENPAR
jgi:uncharacterized protein with ATP-grasp and redox domains